MHRDARLADGVPDLPGARHAVRLYVEVGRQPEVALAPRREADVAADPGDAEGADGGAVEILADDVPDVLVEPERVGVERALADLVALWRPVVELDRPLLRDRRLQLGKAAGELGRVVRRAYPHALGGVGARLVESGPAERGVPSASRKGSA